MPFTWEHTLFHPYTHPDCFITPREAVLPSSHSSGATAATATASTSSPGSAACLANVIGIPLNKRVLAYHEPPSPSSFTFPSAQCTITWPLYVCDPLPSSNGTSSSKSRRVPTTPEHVLDAPGILDGFYLDLISWSALDVVGVVLGESTCLWAANTGVVSHLGNVLNNTFVASVDFSGDRAYIGNGAIELCASSQKLRTVRLNSDASSAGQVANLS